jgi:hypothetical protein
MTKVADWITACWIVFVAVVYYGGYFLPSRIGVYTSNLAAVYALMIIVSVIALWPQLRARLPR